MLKKFRETSLFRLAVLTFILTVGIEKTAAQTVYSINPQGYWPSIFLTGSNLFNNPLDTGSNTLSYLFPTRFPPPEGTIISLWNPTNSSFDTTSTFTNGSWSTNLILPPGTGALVVAPSQFTNAIAGSILNHDGSPFLYDLTPPPLFSGPNGIYLLGDKAPVIDAGTNIFLNILGRMPFVGEQVTLLTGISTYLGNGAWDSIPTLGISDAAFLKIMTEPSPSLTIVYTNNLAIVSWQPPVSVWTLQTNNNLVMGTWGNYVGTIINNTVTNSPTTGNLFFRLSYP